MDVILGDAAQAARVTGEGDTVLIVAPQDDTHANALAAVIKADFALDAVLWDRGALPAQGRLDLTLDGAAGRCMRLDGLVGGARASLTQADLRSVWWRRAEQPRIDAVVTDPKVRRYCVREYEFFVNGLLNALDVPIVNHPAAESRAEYKPYQLAMAQELGIAVPRTLMSNDPASVRAFWQEMEGRCVYKSFTAPYWTFSETRLLEVADLDHLAQLRHAPIIVQEKIEKGRDVRVNIFGEAFFAASVDTHVPEAGLDWRLDQTALWREHDLPGDVGAALVGLLRRLGLQMGCIDLRQQPDGSYVFLEVNPSGQFLFIEIDTGQPLLRALAQLLVNPSRTLTGDNHGHG